jgi:hypothetical protein
MHSIASCCNEPFKQMMLEEDTPCTSTQIIQLLDRVAVGIKIDAGAMSVVLALSQDILLKICKELDSLAMHNDTLSISSKTVITAVNLCYIGQLARGAVKDINDAIEDINNTKLLADNLPTLLISTSQVHKLLIHRSPNLQFSKKAVIAVTAAIQYMLYELLELSGYKARDFLSANVTPKCVLLAFLYDEELNAFFKGSCAGITYPFIQPLVVRYMSFSNEGTDKIASSRMIEQGDDDTVSLSEMY